MTVTYTAEVATSSFGCFLKLLIRWKGSIYKLMWREFLIFMLTYYVLNFSYRFGMSNDNQRIFEKLARYCDSYGNLIPVAFVLGFYVSIVVGRWWDQFENIPWPDRMALFTTASIHGHDERGRLMRRTIMRYLCLAYVITMSSISPPVKKRFPTFTHMAEAGFMLPRELQILEDIKTPHNKYFVPIVWSTSLVTRARKEGRIKDDFAVKTLIDEINRYRGSLGELFNYDWMSVPLVYTQVVTLAVYMFFLSCLMGRQFLKRPNVEEADMFVPIFTFLQFFFYMGWLKVAESLVNPFGEDDDDFDINRVIDRNLQVSYLVVDGMHQDHPELIKDQYWDDVEFELPYTAAAAEFRVQEPQLGSAMDINLDEKDVEFIPLSSIQEEGNMEDIRLENLMEMGATPTNIPARQLSQTDAVSEKTNFSGRGSRFKHLLHSFKDSRRTLNRDSPITGSRKFFHKGSQTSGLDCGSQASPTITSMNPEEIFSMSDLSINDPDEDDNHTRSHLLDSIASQDFLHMLRSRAASANKRQDLHGAKHQDYHKHSTKATKSPEKVELKAKPEEIELKQTDMLQSQSSMNLEPIVEGMPENGDNNTAGSDSSKQSSLRKAYAVDDGTGIVSFIHTKPKLPTTLAGDLNSAVEAIDNLRFKQEKDRPELPPRSRSIAGGDTTVEPQLYQPPSPGDVEQGLSHSQGPLTEQQPPSREPSVYNEPRSSVHDSLEDDRLLDPEDYEEVSDDGMTWKKTPVTKRVKRRPPPLTFDKSSPTKAEGNGTPSIVHSTQVAGNHGPTSAAQPFGETPYKFGSPLKTSEKPVYTRILGSPLHVSSRPSALSRNLDMNEEA